MMPRASGVLLVLLAIGGSASAQQPVEYHLSVPAPEHHWMQVEATFRDLPPGTLEVRMSRSSPGRYALHEFAKNVYDVRTDDGAGRPLAVERPNPSEWDVRGHAGTVRIRYRVYGRRTDGTFLDVDPSHAHINMPAVFMWARGLEDRPARVRLDAPAGSSWTIATQLHDTAEPQAFTAPNLAYLMDSPMEASRLALRSFTVDGRIFRLALHYEGAAPQVDRLARDLERVVRAEKAVFGTLPIYEGGRYTFLVDDLPFAYGDGMEHRNSTVITRTGRLDSDDDRMGLLAAAAHELFHGWNVERIRPRSLEPFRLDAANSSAELWFAEGFTNYYQAVVLQRSGLAVLGATLRSFGRDIDRVIRAPGRRYRSAADMSRLAPFVDAASFVDPVDLDNTYISYYTWGAALGLGLDLSLRERSGGRLSLDDFMRAVWNAYGAAGASEGIVPHPYTMRDLRDRLAEVSGDRRFADDFFDRYVEGREVLDYAALLARAGVVLRKARAGRAWIGDLVLRPGEGGVEIAAPTLEGSPAYEGGLDVGDRDPPAGWTPRRVAHRPGGADRTPRAGRPGLRAAPAARRAARVDAHGRRGSPPRSAAGRSGAPGDRDRTYAASAVAGGVVAEHRGHLVRGIGLWQATALNMIDMIGVGPFITIPLIIAAMHGPQAIVGWVLGALLVACDGLVWAELGASFPEAGGPVRYLREMYGPRFGKLLSFLFVWQLTFSAPLSIASGCIGLAQYAGYLWPQLRGVIAAHRFDLSLPAIGTIGVDVTITPGTFVAMAAVAFAVFLLYRRITIIGRLASFLWIGVIGSAFWITLSGLLHFNPRQAFAFPPGAWTLSYDFFLGLGSALLIAVYDYWGYYNVCYLGGEVRDPARTIPRAILLSIAGVAAIYLSMNIAILGSMPWQEVQASTFIASDFMQRIWGVGAARVITVLMIWTAFASVFSLVLGYSRGAVRGGARRRLLQDLRARASPPWFPHVSLLTLGGVAMVFCLFRLADVVTALVVIRVMVQFLAQTIGVIVLRSTRPEVPRPFRMWLYPVPAVLAFLGFVYLLIMRPKSLESIRVAIALIVIGAVLFAVRRAGQSRA